MTTPLDDGSPLPLDWVVRVETIPAQGLAVTRGASLEERARLAAALDLIEVARLDVTGRIVALAGGIYRLTGRLGAEVAQRCVVTLDPVHGRIDEELAVEFRPAADVRDDLDTTPDLNEPFDIEPFEHGQLEIGRVVYELVAASLDPYPRSAGAGVPLDLVSKPKGATDGHPFAVLAKLKDTSGGTGSSGTGSSGSGGRKK